MHFKYCPNCGMKLSKKLAGDDGLVPFCEKCNNYWFDMFPTCVIILVYNEYNEIALLRQGYVSDKYSSFVAGYIQSGENAEQTAIREVKEEIGITLKSIELVGSYWFDNKGMLMIGFLGYAHKKDLTLSKEVDSASWVKADDAPKYMFPNVSGNCMYPLYEKFLEKRHLKH